MVKFPRLPSDYAITTMFASLVGLVLLIYGIQSYPEVDMVLIALGAGWTLATVYWAQLAKFWRER